MAQAGGDAFLEKVVVEGKSLAATGIGPGSQPKLV